MRAVDIIYKKRTEGELSRDELDFLVHGFTCGDVPDYQMAAWLMAVMWRGMTDRETVELTMSMAGSGRILDLSAVAPLVADKHSTGGVGDKTTLVVAPLVASAGLPVGKMSGRGLSFTGGTLDKLESIPGFRVEIDEEQFQSMIREHGIVVAGQSEDLAPADGKMYSLRDVTDTVESLPLIASSVMSKKIAAGANVIVLDVKTGSGAFMKTTEDAVALAQAMVSIGRGAGRKVAAVISDMDQPLGNAVGNAVEVAEAIATLKGQGPVDLTDHCIGLGAEMLLLGDRCQVVEQGQELLRQAISQGRAIAKFREWVQAQGGDSTVADDPGRMKGAKLHVELESPRGGYIVRLGAMDIGLAAVALGAGRAKKGDAVDHGVGIILHHKVGDWVDAGEPLLTILANDEGRLEEARSRLTAAVSYCEEPPSRSELVKAIIR